MGLFRVRDKFNVKADGYWMKGKCFLPGDRLGMADSSAVFTDTGVVVRNRKGKRKPRKTKANVEISYTFYGIISRSIQEIGGLNHTCHNTKVCRHRVTRSFLEETVVDAGREITGMTVRIIGWKGDRGIPEASAETTIICTVGRVS